MLAPEPELPPVNAPLAVKVKASILRARFLTQHRPGTPVRTITLAVCDCFRVTLAEVYGSRRTMNLVVPRQVAIAIIKLTTRLSLPKIGEQFGGRDHTTILHSVRRQRDVVTAALAEIATEQLAGGAE